ncbi:MAG: urease accessory UreF family protein, partial [Burkholderiales bacterium]
MSLALVRLLQLASPALPVGAYSYSQGLESAVEAGFVKTAAAVKAWIGDLIHFNVAAMEAPLGVRLYRAWRDDDNEGARYWNSYALASRETMELRAESAQMGYSLTRLLADGNFCDKVKLTELAQLETKSFTAVFSFAAVQFG